MKNKFERFGHQMASCQAGKVPEALITLHSESLTAEVFLGIMVLVARHFWSICSRGLEYTKESQRRWPFKKFTTGPHTIFTQK